MRCPYVTATRLGDAEAFCVLEHEHFGRHAASPYLSRFLSPSPTWHLPNHSTIGSSGVTNQDDNPTGAPVADDHERHVGHAVEDDDVPSYPYDHEANGWWVDGQFVADEQMDPDTYSMWEDLGGEG